MSKLDGNNHTELYIAINCTYIYRCISATKCIFYISRLIQDSNIDQLKKKNTFRKQCLLIRVKFLSLIEASIKLGENKEI